MRDFTPPVVGRYGAPMGRPSNAYIPPPGSRVRLFRVPINNGGYDRGGAYWGIGDPLYCASGPGGEVVWFRANDRGAAKDYVMGRWPGVRFYK